MIQQTDYVKLINNRIEYAPKNKGSILNYNLNVELMLADGYKPFVEVERPTTIRRYHIEYVETDVITEVVVFDETQEEAEECIRKTRQEGFENQFFYIPEVVSSVSNEIIFTGGYYRKQPKGYSSAIESITTAYTFVKEMTFLPANTLIFYTAPDFTKPEECTEEWLIEHQFSHEQLSEADFMKLYITFISSWNNTQH